MRNSNQDSNINLKSTLKHIAKAWLHCIHQDKWMSGILLDIMNALATTKLKIKGLGFRFGREWESKIWISLTAASQPRWWVLLYSFCKTQFILPINQIIWWNWPAGSVLLRPGLRGGLTKYNSDWNIHHRITARNQSTDCLSSPIIEWRINQH